jgi:hypothetical protein
VPSPNVAPVKIGLVCSAAALLTLSTSPALPGAETQVRLPVSTVGLNEAIFRSDIIETAEIVSPGDRSGRALFLVGIKLKPSAVHKGGADGQGSTSFSVTVRGKEATLRTGEEFIVFISSRVIIKVLPKTNENLREL